MISKAADTSKRQVLAIIGGGMAAVRFAELMAKKSSKFDIVIFQEELKPPYNRIMLSPVLAGEKRFDEIILKPQEWFLEHGIRIHAGVKVTQVNPAERTIRGHAVAASTFEEGGGEVEKEGEASKVGEFSSQEQILCRYDKLVFASGSHGRRLDIPGAIHDDVHVFRSQADVEKLLSYPRTDSRGQALECAVIGAGLLGLEAANALASQGFKVHVIHHAASILNRQLDTAAADYLVEHYHEQHQQSLQFVLNAKTLRIEAIQEDSSNHFGLRLHLEQKGGRLAAGEETTRLRVDCSFVVMAVGVVPNVECAKRSGLKVSRGIHVDDRMQTSHTSVYAIGECVEFQKQTFGLVAPVYDQAEVLAHHLLAPEQDHADHQDKLFAVRFTPTKLKVSGVNLFSAGDVSYSDNCEILQYQDKSHAIYKRLVLQDNRIIGIILYGDILDGNWYFELMEHKSDVSAIKDTLLFGKGFCEDLPQSSLEPESNHAIHPGSVG